MKLFVRKLTGVAIILGVSICAVAMSISRPSELRQIPGKTMEMIREMMR